MHVNNGSTFTITTEITRTTYIFDVISTDVFIQFQQQFSGCLRPRLQHTAPVMHCSHWTICWWQNCTDKSVLTVVAFSTNLFTPTDACYVANMLPTKFFFSGHHVGPILSLTNQPVWTTLNACFYVCQPDNGFTLWYHDYHIICVVSSPHSYHEESLLCSYVGWQLETEMPKTTSCVYWFVAFNFLSMRKTCAKCLTNKL